MTANVPSYQGGIPAGWAVVQLQGCSLNRIKLSCLLSAWKYRCPHKTLSLHSLHISPALQAHQVVVINRGQPLSIPYIMSGTLYMKSPPPSSPVHSLQCKDLHSSSSKFYRQNPCSLDFLSKSHDRQKFLSSSDSFFHRDQQHLFSGSPTSRTPGQ